MNWIFYHNVRVEILPKSVLLTYEMFLRGPGSLFIAKGILLFHFQLCVCSLASVQTQVGKRHTHAHPGNRIETTGLELESKNPGKASCGSFCVGMYASENGRPWRPEVCNHPGVTGSCELPNMHSGNQTAVLCKRSICP